MDLVEYTFKPSLVKMTEKKRDESNVTRWVKYVWCYRFVKKEVSEERENREWFDSN